MALSIEGGAIGMRTTCLFHKCGVRASFGVAWAGGHSFQAWLSPLLLPLLCPKGERLCLPLSLVVSCTRGHFRLWLEAN